MTDSTIRIATRSSKLALWQAEHVAGLIRTASPQTGVEILHVRTEGDQNQADPLRQFGGMGVFTREVQRAVLDHTADIAVHSLKDLPTESAAGLTIGAVPERAPRCDAVVLPRNSQPLSEVGELPRAARIGTGSPRRGAQLLHLRPDLRITEIRGNVDTRLKKLDAGEFDAILLAEAGLRRLGLTARISLVLRPPTLFPAVGQGALGIECRDDDHTTCELLSLLTDQSALAEITAERTLLRDLRAGCHAPLGAWAQLEDQKLSLTGVLLSIDGKQRLQATASGGTADAALTGSSVAAQLLAAGGDVLVGQF